MLKFRKKGPASPLPAKVVLPHLIDATKDAFAGIRVSGLQSLAGLGADAKEAVPAVTALLDDPDARVRMQAQLTLNQIRGK